MENFIESFSTHLLTVEDGFRLVSFMFLDNQIVSLCTIGYNNSNLIM